MNSHEAGIRGRTIKGRSNSVAGWERGGKRRGIKNRIITFANILKSLLFIADR